jgi:hypothetical protein
MVEPPLPTGTIEATPVRRRNTPSTAELRRFRPFAGPRWNREVRPLAVLADAIRYANPKRRDPWSLTSFKVKPINIGAKVIGHCRYTAV